MTLFPIIMCGGAGTRLWPVSNQACPKQFRRLVSDRSVFQETALRFQGAAIESLSPRPIIVSNAAYADLIESQLAEIGVTAEAILLEPEGRNTAAVAAVAAHYMQQMNPQTLGLLVPSDHHIGAPDAFRKAVQHALSVARDGFITTFGIQPTRPDTGFGYIETGETLDAPMARIKAFREKPDAETARGYLASGRFNWNAGIFLFRADVMARELDAYAQGVNTPAITALTKARKEGARLYLDPVAFSEVQSISIDYAVMEKTRHAAVYAPLECAWSDIGTWSVIGEVSQRAHPLRPVEIDAKNCLVHADGNKLVALVGVDDLVVVIDGDNILVAHKSRAQDVGAVVKTLKERGLKDHL